MVVPWFASGARPDLTYLDTASIALVPDCASRAMRHWFDEVSSAGTAYFDEDREAEVTRPAADALALMLGVRAEDVAVGSSATEFLASAAWALAPPAGSRIIVPANSFPSTVLPWRRVSRTTGAELVLAHAGPGACHTEAMLEAIDARTSVVALADVDYRTGYRYDLHAISTRASEVGARVVVDASQSFGLVQPEGLVRSADVIVASGYKWLCGPLGSAMIYVSPKAALPLDPGILGFRSRADMWALQQAPDELAAGAKRFEAGSMYYGAALGLAESIRFLASVGGPAVEAHGIGLARLLVGQLTALGFDCVIPEHALQSGIVSVRPPQGSEHGVVSALRAAGVAFSVRGELLRFSPHVYNQESDVLRVADVLRRARLLPVEV